MNKHLASSLTLALSLALAASTGCSMVRAAMPGSRSAPATAAAPGDGASAAAETSSAKPVAAMTPLQRACASSVEKIGPEPGQNTGNEPQNLRRRWQPVVIGARREQFVTVTKGFQALNDVGSRFFKRQVAPGEPLLVEHCFVHFDEIKSVKVRTIDGEFDHSVDANLIDPAPRSFTWDTPAFAKAPTISSAYGNATPEDRASIQGLVALDDTYNECRTEAMGYCMSAEQQVEAGPPRADLKAAKQRACDAARKKSMGRCWSAANDKKLQRMIDELEALSAKRHEQFHAQMRTKLGSSQTAGL